MHRGLLRLLRRSVGVEDEEALQRLIERARERAGQGADPQLDGLLRGLGELVAQLQAGYEQHERDLALCNRSLELSSAELNASNDSLRAQLAERGRAIRHLREVLCDLSADEADGGEGGPSAEAQHDLDALSRRLTALMRERAAHAALLRNLVHAIPALVWLKDEHGVYLDCNERFEQLYGAPREQIIGRRDEDFIAAELAEELRADDRKAVREGRATVKEEWATYADGHRERVETTKTPVFDEQGGLVGVLGIAFDITARRRTEEALRESERRFRHLLEQVPSISVQGYDAERRVIFWNAASERLYGYRADEAMGCRLEALIIPPPMRGEVQAAVTAWLAGGDAIPAGELQLLRKDGRPVPVFSSHVMQRGADGRPEMYCIDIDLSELKQAEDRLRLAASVFTHAWEGIIITDPQGTVVEVNEAFSRITGYAREEAIGRNPRFLRSDRHDAAFFGAMWQALTEHGFWHGELWNRRKDGSLYLEQLTISAVRDNGQRILHYVGLFADITAQKAHEAELEYLAHHDGLTELPNRSLLHDRLQHAMAQAARRRQHLAVAYIDLDGFKSINDRHGHETGDQLLRVLARQMKTELREGDTIARLGGDEFVAVLVDLPQRIDFAPYLDRLLEVLSHPLEAGGQTLQVSASIGVTLYPQADSVDADQLLRQADLAMYQAKLAGKNRYHLFDTELDRSVRGHHESIARIRRALLDDELALYYQPKVNLRSGRVTGAEALIRWLHPERGILPPAAFLPEIEHHPLGVELGDWVIGRALAQVDHWQAQGLSLTVSVNISAPHLQHPDFVQRLAAHLAAHPAVRPERLELEVLETSALEDMAHVSALIGACRALGVEFALDDFGTGYSSLTYLKRLPVRVLKIDQSFVRDMLDDPDDLAILEGVLGLTRAFGRQAVAEGVESVRHGERLLQLGCEQAQGYGIARPMPAGEFPAWLAAWRPDPAWQGLEALDADRLVLLRASVDFRAWFRRMDDWLGGRSQAEPALPIDETALACCLLRGKGLGAQDPGAARLALLFRTLAGHAQAGAAAMRRAASAETRVLHREALAASSAQLLREIDDVLRRSTHKA